MARCDTSVSHSAAAQQERGSRFGVASLQTVWKTPGRELVIVNAAATGPEGLLQDLRQDLVALSTSCTARLSGRRRATRRKNTPVLAALAEEGEREGT